MISDDFSSYNFLIDLMLMHKRQIVQQFVPLYYLNERKIQGNLIIVFGNGNILKINGKIE